MRTRIRQKWRPPLALVIGGTLAAVLCLPLLGIGYFRVAGNILGWGETSWLIGWMAVLATAILAFLLWRLVLRPVYALTAHAKAIGAGQGDTQLPEHFGTPEFSELARAVQDMAAALQNREAGIRAYSDHVTHEMKSPLTAISAAAELLEGAPDADDRAALVSSIRTSAARMEALLDALRRLAAARRPIGTGPTRLSELAEALGAGCDLAIKVEGQGAVPLDREGAIAVLEQLAQNAENHGALSLTLRISGQSLIVCDDGPGIPEGDRARVFDPFFTTRRGNGGTGMGLAIARAMLEASGAEIELQESRSGTCFALHF